MLSTTKIDLLQEYKNRYTAAVGKIAEVTVPEAQYLLIRGKGDPNTSKDYKDAVEALFAVAYAIKFAVKKAKKIDYSVMPLEGLWGENGSGPASGGSKNKDDWSWTAMIFQPDSVDKKLYEEVLAEVTKKKGLPALAKLSLETYKEGKSIQTMHVGPYEEEHPAIESLHSYAKERGYKIAGNHHEIYLNTPQRTAPEKLKTILRQPVQSAT